MLVSMGKLPTCPLDICNLIEEDTH